MKFQMHFIGVLASVLAIPSSAQEICLNVDENYVHKRYSIDDSTAFKSSFDSKNISFTSSDLSVKWFQSQDVLFQNMSVFLKYETGQFSLSYSFRNLLLNDLPIVYLESRTVSENESEIVYEYYKSGKLQRSRHFERLPNFPNQFFYRRVMVEDIWYYEEGGKREYMKCDSKGNGVRVVYRKNGEVASVTSFEDYMPTEDKIVK